MKKLFLICLPLIGCAASTGQSSIDSQQDQSVVDGVGGGKPEFYGSSGSGDVCQGQKEVREFILNGEVYFLFVPILCNDQWQDPSDPVSESLLPNQVIIDQR